MSMIRHFTALFVLSLVVLGGTLYWRAFHPEGEAVTVASQPAPQSAAKPGASDAARNLSGSGSAVTPAASDRQDLAVTVSILSSVISALAAVLQTWFTRRAVLPPRA